MIVFSRRFVDRQDSGTVFVPGQSGRRISVAVKDVRLAIVDDNLAVHISETNDRLEMVIDDEVEELLEADVEVAFETTVYAPDIDHASETIVGSSVSLPNVGDRLDVFWPLG